MSATVQSGTAPSSEAVIGKLVIGSIIATTIWIVLTMILGRAPIYYIMYSATTIERMDAAQRAQDAMFAQTTMFRVACAKPEMSVDDQVRWVAYAKEHNWTPYPAAGPLCYDP